ncbi:MAG: cation-transporting P-type ATPase, partial [Firmicutes bacterium]|nr:cation-transporting P-type ATPase [Bacillota bacterium]
MADWYKKESSAVLEEKGVNAETGLAPSEVVSRQEKYGLNKFHDKKKEHLVIQILKHFKDPAIIILVVGAILATVINFFIDVTIGSIIKPIVIAGIIVLNITLAVVQERGAERALEALAVLNSPRCFVLRDGKREQIDTADVVPGDI